MFALIASAVFFIHFFRSASLVGKSGLSWGVGGAMAFYIPTTLIQTIAEYIYVHHGIEYERGEFWLYVSIFAGPIIGIVIAHLMWTKYQASEAEFDARSRLNCPSTRAI